MILRDRARFGMKARRTLKISRWRSELPNVTASREPIVPRDPNRLPTPIPMTRISAPKPDRMMTICVQAAIKNEPRADIRTSRRIGDAHADHAQGRHARKEEIIAAARFHELRQAGRDERRL